MIQRRYGCLNLGWYVQGREGSPAYKAKEGFFMRKVLFALVLVTLLLGSAVSAFAWHYAYSVPVVRAPLPPIHGTRVVYDAPRIVNDAPRVVYSPQVVYSPHVVYDAPRIVYDAPRVIHVPPPPVVHYHTVPVVYSYPHWWHY